MERYVCLDELEAQGKVEEYFSSVADRLGEKKGLCSIEDYAHLHRHGAPADGGTRVLLYEDRILAFAILRRDAFNRTELVLGTLEERLSGEARR